MQLREKLIQFLNAEFLSVGEVQNIPLDYDLVDSGLVDSLGLLKLVSFIEEHLKVSIAPEAMTPDNFRTLAAMLRTLGESSESPA